MTAPQLRRSSLRNRLAAALFLVGGIAGALCPGRAAAQFPVCASPAAGEVFRTSCRSWETQSVVQLLDEFTVDHLLKPELPAFERTWMQLFAPFTSKNLVESEAFRALARSLEPLRFTQLDRTTGTVSADLASAPREVDVEALGFGEAVRLQLRFPQALDGGYWRGPDVLQVAFWERYRLGLTVTRAGAEIASGDVECLALSPDGLMIRFAGKEHPPVFLRIRDCER